MASNNGGLGSSWAWIPSSRARRFFQRFAPGAFEVIVFRNRGVVSFAEEVLEQGTYAFLRRFAEMIPATIQEIIFDIKCC